MIPLFVASGCGGTGRELVPYLGTDGLAGLGGFVTRTFTVDPRAGGRLRIAESPAGLVRAHQLQNPGIDRFLMAELPWLAQQGVRTWVSITGSTLAEHTDLVRRLTRAPGVAGIELNLAIDDPRRAGLFDATEPFQAARVVTAVRAEMPSGMPLHAKLVADPVRVAAVARAVHDAGADALVVGGALPSALANGTPAELSGPAVRPVALRCLTAVRSGVPEATLIGVGGITTVDDVRTFAAAGASAVQVGTALLHDPTTVARMAAELAQMLAPTPDQPAEDTGDDQ